MDHNLAIKALTNYFGTRGYPNDLYPKILKKAELLIATGRVDFNAAYKHANDVDKYYKEGCFDKWEYYNYLTKERQKDISIVPIILALSTKYDDLIPYTKNICDVIGKYCHKEVDKIYDKIATLESTEYMNKSTNMRKEIIDNLFDAYMVYIYTLATRIIDGSLPVID